MKHIIYFSRQKETTRLAFGRRSFSLLRLTVLFLWMQTLVMHGQPFVQNLITVANNPVSVAVGDFNGDGIPDIVIAPYYTGTMYSETGAVQVLLGKGNGAFYTQSTPYAGWFPHGVIAADVNLDGKLDLVVLDWIYTTGGLESGVNCVFLCGKRSKC